MDPVCIELDFTPRVLLAEDDRGSRHAAELILGGAGVAVTCVENCLEALDAFSTQAFDLILMDMQMPQMNGPTAIRAIREQEAAEHRPHTPIYMLTAQAMSGDAQAARQAGADACLAKPMTADALVGAVLQARLSRQAPAAAKLA